MPDLVQALTWPYLNHAVRMYESGYASRDDIDAAMRFGCGYPEGPLAAADRVGLDALVEGLRAAHAVSDDARHEPAALLVELVDRGHHGRVHGAGLHEYVDGEITLADRGQHRERADATTVQQVGVVGTGTMAGGIAEVFARAGYDVVLVGRAPERVERALGGIRGSLDRAVSKGRLEHDAAEATMTRLRGAVSRAELGEVDLVVEAVAEDLAVKAELYRDLDRICRPDAVLATTTSSLPVTDLAKATSRPEAVIGMHFFNPAPVMKLVEVVSTELTSPEATHLVHAVSAAVGKVSVSCSDRAGFIVNALLFPYLNDAVKLVQGGHDPVEVDAVMTASGLPMGPFALLDVVGIDVSLAIQQQLHAEFGVPGLAPAQLLIDKVVAGELGRKAGVGFHDYRT